MGPMEGSDWERFVEDLQEPEVLFALQQAEALQAQSLVRTKSALSLLHLVMILIERDKKRASAQRFLVVQLGLVRRTACVLSSSFLLACILPVIGIRAS